MNFKKFAAFAKQQSDSEKEEITSVNENSISATEIEDNEIYIDTDDADGSFDTESFSSPDKMHTVNENLAETPVEATVALSDEQITDEINNYVSEYFSDKAILIETDRLLEYKHHTFAPMKDGDFERLCSDIKKIGIQEPLLVRSIGNGEYEIISGNNRKKAAEALGWTKVPCRVGDNDILTDDMADEIMVSCNLNRRQKMLPSETAHSIALLMGNRKTDENNDGGRIRDKVAADFGISSTQVQRYIKLNNLTDELMSMVDSEIIPFVAGTIIGELSADNMHLLYDVLSVDSELKVTTDNAKRLVSADNLNADLIAELLVDKNEKPVKVSVSSEIYNFYFGEKTSKEIKQIVDTAIKEYFERHTSNE